MDVGKKGKRDGGGKMTFASGTYRSFDGEWSENFMNGKGVLEYRNGNRFEGSFKKGKHHGNGILSYANGSEIVGKWTKGVLDGRFTFQSAHFSLAKEQCSITGVLKEETVMGTDTFFYAPRLPIFCASHEN